LKPRQLQFSLPPEELGSLPEFTQNFNQRNHQYHNRQILPNPPLISTYQTTGAKARLKIQMYSTPYSPQQRNHKGKQSQTHTIRGMDKIAAPQVSCQSSVDCAV